MAKYSHWTKDPKNAERAEQWRKAMSRAQFARNKSKPKTTVVWNQDPANKEKARAQTAVARAAKQLKNASPFRQHLNKALGNNKPESHSFISQMEALYVLVQKRLEDINKEIKELETERALLAEKFNIRASSIAQGE